MNYIDIAEAKKHIMRISESAILKEPLLLVGGIAVNQYIITRRSQDIDLVCDFETSRLLVEELYPTNEWNITEHNEDEYRPSFIMQHKINNNYPVIKIGPKITERDSYKYLNWEELKDTTAKYRHNNKTFSNILIPTAEALCYMKFVSFLGRADTQIPKLKQDLRDIRDLSNRDSFMLGKFLNLIAKNDFGKEIETRFSERLSLVNETLDNCNLGTITMLLSNSISRRHLRTQPTVAENAKTKVVVFDLDGTLIKGIRHSWTLLWSELGADNKVHLERKHKFYEGKLSYLEWTRLDCEDLKKLRLNRSHFKKIASSGNCALTKNLIPAVQRLRDNGIITAIISGGIDALLYELLPQADDLFDEIFINRFIFSDDGSLQSISSTEYDWDDNKLGVAGKNKGLERICEKNGIPIENSVFVGDDRNDFVAMRNAGTKIFYCGDTREFGCEQLPMGLVIIPDNNLMAVADKILYSCTEDDL